MTDRERAEMAHEALREMRTELLDIEQRGEDTTDIVSRIQAVTRRLHAIDRATAKTDLLLPGCEEGGYWQ